MDSFGQKIPEFKYSSDANEIPWENAVVWSIMPRVGPRVYEWLEKEHIGYFCWTNGIVNIMPDKDSILSDKCRCIVLPSGFVWVGKNVNVG